MVNNGNVVEKRMIAGTPMMVGNGAGNGNAINRDINYMANYSPSRKVEGN